jgi:hypothetical protein
MAVTYALQQSSVTGQQVITEDQDTLTLWFTLAFAVGTVYAAGGIPVDLTQLFAVGNAAPGASLPTGANPLTPVSLESSRTPGQANLYVYHYVPGTNATNGTVQIFTGAAAQTGLTELTAGAIPAGVSGDTISGKVTFPKL